MKFNLETEINISAKPQEVWQVFEQFDTYPEWNPFVKALKGEVKVGNNIEINMPGMTFKPVVLEFTKNKILRWKGKLWMKGVFDGEHIFKLVDNNDGTTQFIHAEKFSGILVGLTRRKLNGEIRNSFVEMNQALKARVEKTV